jgi:hypothetical protein
VQPALKNTIYKQFKTVLNSLYTVSVCFARVHKRKLNGWSLTAETSGPLSFVLEYSVVAQGLAYDVVLGVDWSSLFRASLISSGTKVPDTFDAWAFCSSRLIRSELYRFTATVVSRPWR